MASTDHLDVDPGGVRAAGAGLSAAADMPAWGQITVSACAADVTSVGVANALAVSISELLASITAVNHTATVSAARLSANSSTYEQQEQLNAAALTEGPSGRGIPLPVAGSPQQPTPTTVPRPLAAVGITPASGKAIAALIHAGPGPVGLDTAATALEAHAGQLESAAHLVRAARATSEQSWDSVAAEVAGRHLSILEASYTTQAGYARALSRDARQQAQNFRRAKALIPAPAVFDDLERRLQAANTANKAPGTRGMYSGVITQLQTELAATHQQAVDNFDRYTADAGLQTRLPAPGVAPTAGSPTGVPAVVADSGDFDQTGNESGSGANDLGSADVRSGDPAGVVDQPPDAAGELLQAVLPTVLGGVVGAAGGLLGALSGLGDKLQQSGSQLLGGLAQGAGQAMSAVQGQAASQGLSDDGDDGFGAGVDGSGLRGGRGAGLPGNTEPASSPNGPLAAAPASTATAPAAAPATYSPSVSAPGATATPVGGMPMGGMMVPPMVGGPRGAGGSGDEDRRLYPEKRLRLETAPNTEPVKGRREARETRSGRGE